MSTVYTSNMTTNASLAVTSDRPVEFDHYMITSQVLLYCHRLVVGLHITK